eukprot:9679082-Karenia_brevis.AAC.1
MLEGARETLLWQQAAQHRHGAGMEGGIDMTFGGGHHGYIYWGHVAKKQIGVRGPNASPMPALHGSQNTASGGNGQKG